MTRYALYRCGLAGGGYYLWDHLTGESVQRYAQEELAEAREVVIIMNYEHEQAEREVAA